MRKLVFSSAMILGCVFLVAASGNLFADYPAFSPGFALENGDTNGDWEMDVSDAIHLFRYLFLGGPAPVPLAPCAGLFPLIRNGDLNGDGQITIGDGIQHLMWLYIGGPEPAPACSAEGGEGAGKAPKEYLFTSIKFLGDPAPGPEGGALVNDFEANGLNNRGEILFGADVSTGGEGVYLFRKGDLSQLARAGEDAPGGGVFDFGFLGPTSLNDEGDAALAFLHSPFSFPVGVNAGVYRYARTRRMLAPVVVPGITPAPGGGTFAGVHFQVSLNNAGDLIFNGIVPTDQGIHLPDEEYIGLGVGVFKADKRGGIFPVVAPGDPAPGGGTFDVAREGWISDGGDIAFSAHVAGEECSPPNSPPQSFFIGCLGSIYVKKAASGEIQSVAHAGDPAPGGGIFRQAYSPVMNNRGDIVFLGDLTSPPDATMVMGIYLHSRGVTSAVARPGDPMPGGGSFVTTSTIDGNQIDVNNLGEVAFNAILDTDDNGDSTLDTGLFVWSAGSVSLVARTGTVIPGAGTVAQLVMGVIVFPPPTILIPNSGALNNDRGQVLFSATLSDGRGVLLLATPKP